MSELRGALVGVENILAGYVSEPDNTLRGDMSIPELINYGTVHTSETFYNTVAGWNAQIDLKSKEKAMYVYTDYALDEHGNHVAAFKIGDGNAYLIDLPFYSTISTEEKEFWNNKVRVYVDPENPENLIFTTN